MTPRSISSTTRWSGCSRPISSGCSSSRRTRTPSNGSPRCWSTSTERDRRARTTPSCIASTSPRRARRLTSWSTPRCITTSPGSSTSTCGSAPKIPSSSGSAPWAPATSGASPTCSPSSCGDWRGRALPTTRSTTSGCTCCRTRNHGAWLEEALVLYAGTERAQREIHHGAMLSLAARARFWTGVQRKIVR